MIRMLCLHHPQIYIPFSHTLLDAPTGTVMFNLFTPAKDTQFCVPSGGGSLTPSSVELLWRRYLRAALDSFPACERPFNMLYILLRVALSQRTTIQGGVHRSQGHRTQDFGSTVQYPPQHHCTTARQGPQRVPQLASPYHHREDFQLGYCRDPRRQAPPWIWG